MSVVKRPKKKEEPTYIEFIIPIEADFVEVFNSSRKTIQEFVSKQTDGTTVDPIEDIFRKRLKTGMINYLNDFKKDTGEFFDMQAEQYLTENTPKPRQTAKQKEIAELKKKRDGIKSTIDKLYTEEDNQERKNKIEKKKLALQRVQDKLHTLDANEPAGIKPIAELEPA